MRCALFLLFICQYDERKSLFLLCNNKFNSLKYQKMSTRQAISTTTVDYISAVRAIYIIMILRTQGGGGGLSDFRDFAYGCVCRGGDLEKMYVRR